MDAYTSTAQTMGLAPESTPDEFAERKASPSHYQVKETARA